MRTSEIRQAVKEGKYTAPYTKKELQEIERVNALTNVNKLKAAQIQANVKLDNEVNNKLAAYNERISQMKQAFASKQPQGVLANNAAAYLSQADTVAATAMIQWLKDRKVQDDNPLRYEVNDKWSLEQKAYLAKLFEESPNKAFEFAADVNTALENDQIYELGKKYPIMGGIVSLGTNVGNVIETPLNYMEYGFEKLSGNEDAKLRRIASADITNNLRSGGANNETISSFKIGDYNAGGFIYNGVLSFLDSQIAGLSGSGVSSAISSKLPTKFPKLLKSVVENLAGGAQLGLSAAASASNDVLDRGGSSGQAIATGAVSWLFESLFEALSLGQMKWFSDSGKATLKSILNSEGKNWLKKFVYGFVDVFGKPMLVNTVEETLTEAANITYDTLVNADISQYAKDIEAFMAQGMSEEKARQKAKENIWAQVGEAAASGTFIGLLSGGGNMISNSNRQRKLYDGLDKTDIRQLVLEGLQSPEGSKAKVLAQKIQNKINAGKNVSTREIASLVATNENQYHAEDIAKIKSAVQSRLTELGEKGNVEALSSAISKDLAGEQLTKSEQRIISESRFGQRVLNEATAENIESGEYSSGWAEKIGTERINSRAYNLGAEGVDSAAVNGYNNTDENGRVGGKVNGSENAELLARGEVSTAGAGRNSLREQSPNTAIIRGELGALSGNQGAADRRLAAGTSGWVSGSDRQPATKVGGGLEENFLRGVRGVALKDTDTIGRQLSPELKEQLRDTVFRDEEGRILSFFHWTPNSFETFKYGDGAFHFGTLPTAISVKGRSYTKVQGNFKEVYINSKNPLVVYDDGSFSPSVVSGQLVEYGLMSADSRNELRNKQGFYSNDINSEACQYMLEYIKELGFDSYFYVNKHENTGGWSVGVFDASQIITVAENGVLKENCGVTEADSSESANFMPENADLQSTADGDAFGLSAANPDYNPIEDLHYKSVGVERLTADQKKLKKAGEQFGAKVLFRDLDEIRIDPKTGKEFLFSPEGQFDPDTNTITLNTNVKEHHRPLEYILKHELTHSLEVDKDNYALFATQVLRSEVFTEYVRSKGFESADTWAAEIIKQYSGKGVKGYQGPKAQLLANQEMVANFVGDMLFGGRTDITEKLLSSMTAIERRDFIAKIKEFFAKLKELFKGSAELTEIERLENLFLETANKVAGNNKTSTEGRGDIVYSGKINNKDKQYSFAAEKETSLVGKAEQLERELKAQGNMSEAEIREAVWKEYQIIRDAEGVWKYEIDDSEMEFYPNGDLLIKDDPHYKEYMALKKMPEWTEEQADRFAELDDGFLLKYDYTELYLKNYLKHDKLFAKYPQLNETKIAFDELGPIVRGYYDPTNNRIVLAERFKMLDKTEMNIDAIHEIQHVMQEIDDTEPGASEEYWNVRLLRGERLPINPDTNKPYTLFEAYMRTRGEIEAREASDRVDMTENERRAMVPNLGWENSLSSREPVLSVEYDAKYASAVKNGNTRKAQQMVDTAAEFFGYTERLYHQTDADFTEFNTNNQKAGKYDWELPTGTFLKPTDNDIGLSGKKQMELYANIKNPLEFDNRYEAQKYWSENIPGYDTVVSEVLSIDAKYRSRVDAAVDAIQQYSKKWKKQHPNESRRAIYNDAEYQRLSDKQADIIEEWESVSNKASLNAKKLIDAYIAENDYDGIIVEHDKDGENRETKSYIVFSSAQLKSAAPVTYDNSGNMISLLQRFNENQSDIRYSIPDENNVENYTEEQYNNFGWVRHNDVLTPAEYSTLLSRHADYKHNKDKYPTTRFGEAVLHSTECIDVIMYVKGAIGNPQITKIVKINYFDTWEIKEEVLSNERRHLPQPYKSIESFYGQEILSISKARDYASFRQYRAEQEGRSGAKSNSLSAEQQYRAGSTAESQGIDKGRTNGLKYSIPSTVDIDSVIEAVERGKMSASEAKELLGRKTLNPTEIANLPKEMADITLIHGKAKRKGSGDKESKFYESALKSKIITAEVKDEIENDTYIKNYHSTTNKRTLKMAMQELDEGGYTRVNEFFNLKPEKGSAVDVAVGFILLERYQRANMTEDALRVAEKLREIGTLSGQTVQMFSVLGRFTPEMMVEYAAKELQKAYEDMVKTKSQAWIDKNKTKFELTQEDIVFIKNNILFASNLEESRQKAILLAEVCTRVQNKIPPESGQSIRALQRISLLLNPKTNIRNILGNANMAGVYVASDFFGNLIDKQIAKKTGVRTTGNYHIKGSGTALKKGIYESYDDFKRGIRTKQDELNRYEVNQGGGKSFNEQHKGPLAKQINALAKAMNTLDNFTSFCLEAGDRPFFEMWFVNSLNNQMRLNNVDVPTPAMLEIARLEAEQRTWQDSNTVSRSMSQLKRVLNKFHIPGTSYGFGDFVLKFVKTPANIAKAMVEFSPIGLVTAGSKAVNFKNALSRGKFDAAMQKEVVRSMSSAITGTLLYVLVAAGVALGTIELSGAGDDDKDVSNFEKYIVGIPPYSMKIFGQNATYSWNQPVGVILATVADFMESKEDGISAPWYEDLLGAFKTGTAVFTEQSFLSSLYELFSADDLATGIFDAVLSEPSAFFPQFVSQIASFIDPYRRTTYHKGNAWRSALNGIIYKIPGLRKTLPEQVNVLGETSKNTQYLNPWEAFLSPGNTYPESSGDVAKEIYELYKLTGNNAVMPRTAPYSYTVKGETVSLSPEERNEFQRVIGTESVRILNALFNSADYKALTDEQKSDAVQKVYDYAYDKAKSQRKYKYETVAAMTGGEKVLPKAKWDKLNSDSRRALVDDYFFTNDELKCKDDANKLILMFVKKTKE